MDQADRTGGMTGGGSKGGQGGKDGISLDDFRLWKEFTRDIEPLEEPDWSALEALIAETSPSAPVGEGSSETVFFPAPTPQKRMTQAPQLDGRTDQRLHRGKLPIEGTLDLHGRTQEQAHALLTAFVLGASAQGKRCLLVITGKGRSTAGGAIFDVPEGILKQRVPDWLMTPPLRDVILKIYPASPAHGGSGALYLYLRRRREY